MKSSVMKYVWKLNEDIQNAAYNHRMRHVEINKLIMMITYKSVYISETIELLIYVY